MGKPAQGRFNPADDNRFFFKGLTDQVAVHHRRIIRSSAHNTAR